MKAVKLLAAAAIGFAAGVLLAPKSGKETREDIKSKALDAKDYATDKADKVKKTVLSGYDTVRDEAGNLVSDVTEFAGRAKKSADELASDAKTRGTRAATRAKSAGRRIQDDAEKNLR